MLKTSHDRIMTAQEASMEQAEYNQLLDDLQQAAQDYDQQAL